jgi:hypothetical protein
VRSAGGYCAVVASGAHGKAATAPGAAELGGAAELVKAVQLLEAQIKDLQARVEALERLRAPRAVPSP